MRRSGVVLMRSVGGVKKMNKESLDKMSLKQIEIETKKYQTKAKNNRKHFIENLQYLEMTKRYRDDEMYTNSTFSEYIIDKFELKKSTYERERFAYLQFPKESLEYGPGIINKIKDECGSAKIKDVIKEIKKTSTKKREKINDIIKKNAKPVKSKPERTEPTPKEMRLRIAFLEDENKTLRQSLLEKNDQINKLKKTISALKQYKSAYNQIIPVYERVQNSLKNLCYCTK